MVCSVRTGVHRLRDYGSLLPFDLRPLRLEDAWNQYRDSVMTLPSGRISPTDVLTNILLFVPVGFSLSAALLADRRRWPGLVWAIPLIVALSLLVSMAAEFLQLFTSDHVASGSDITAQTVGCLAGILVWTLAGQAMTTWTRETLAAAPQDRVSRALTAYAFLWILFNLAPFDITVDLVVSRTGAPDASASFHSAVASCRSPAGCGTVWRRF